MRVSVSFTVNGAPYDLELEPRRLLSDALRHDLRLTGTHVGCEHGVCGACTVLLDGQPVRSCLMLAVSAQDHEITTVEGLGTPEQLGPVQAAFHEHYGSQCGFCTPGFLLATHALIERSPQAGRAEIEEALAGHVCRCTGYVKIIEAVEAAVGGAS